VATAAQRKAANLRRSLQRAIKDRIETDNVDPNGRAYKSGWIDYDSNAYDNSSHNHWAQVLILSPAGQFGVMLVQINCFSRYSDNNNLGFELEEMIDLFLDAMRESDARIQIYDYSTPASPTAIAGRYLVPLNSNGKFGEPESIVNIEPPEGTKAKAITYHLKIHPDDFVLDSQRYDPSV